MGEIIAMTEMRILLVEDNSADAELIRGQLEDGGLKNFRVTHAKNIASGLQLLYENSFNAVLLDLSLPDAHDLDGFLALQNAAPMLPIVILTARDDERLALMAVEKGAQDYLHKDKSHGDTLRIAISYAIQRKRFEDGITRQANFDSLTGLANRQLFGHRLDMLLAKFKRTGCGVGVLFLDLNDFKRVNDTLGHAAGDMLLKEIAQRMVHCVRPYDTIARIGGDEFAVIVEDIKDPHDCAQVAQKFIDAISIPVEMAMQRITVGASIGIATAVAAQPDNVTSSLLIDQADTAMYRAKENEGNSFCFYTSDMNEALQFRRQLEAELATAVRNQELTLCYQPKQSLESGFISGVEALVRWDHPRLGTLLPETFLEVAREIHMLDEIEAWVMNEVCKDMHRWRVMNLPLLQVSVNISATCFDSPDFLMRLVSLIEKHGIQPELLAIELPEEIFASASFNRAQTFAKLYKLGIGISMDKFGGHMSSLQSLKGIALSEIKFDSRFSQSAGGQAEDLRLIKTIVACAHALGIRVVASGVESEALRDQLRQQQCDAIQGFIYKRPMPAPHFEAWLSGKERGAVATTKRLVH